MLVKKIVRRVLQPVHGRIIPAEAVVDLCDAGLATVVDVEAVAAAETVGTDAMKRLYVCEPSRDDHLVYHLIGSVSPSELFKSIYAGKPDAFICGDVLQKL